MRHHEVIGYTYEADVHCTSCARERFGGVPDGHEDREGNPVHAMFAGDEGADEEHCGDCGEKLL